ncbi:MAG: hypothetical protein U9N04_03920 [Patescibacteria group bacterium]|nr:hypothetical protein [Patescibacteria group bacterium]
MKKILIIILTIIGLLGIFIIISYTKENPTENNIQNFTENIGAENNESDEEEFSDDHEHDHSVEIEGSEMKNLTVQEVADLWEIDAEILLSEIIAEFDLKGDYTAETVLEEIRDAEYKFSPAIIKDLAEEIKYPNQK